MPITNIDESIEANIEEKTKKQIAVPGILGGLGPLAHIELEKRILQQRHQQHEISRDRS